MRAKWIVGIVIAAALVANALAARGLSRYERAPQCDPAACRRIVSLAPSVTETLFALGLGPRVVGVSRFCDYPPEARNRPHIGGYFDPNYEAVAALRPDLVVGLVEHEENMPAFARLGLPTLTVCQQNLDGILDSILTIGRSCGVAERADEIVGDIRRRMERIREKTAGLDRPRVLIVIDRNPGQIEDCYVAGSDGVFDRILELVGGENACQTALRFPVVSSEGIVWMNPQVIIDMTSGITASGPGSSQALADWRRVGQVEAVREGRVRALQADYAFRPGPRVINLAESLLRLVHPEVDWK